MHWSLALLGAALALVGIALARQFRVKQAQQCRRRVILLEIALDNLLQAVERDDRVDSLPHRLYLAVMRAREALER